jgi:uridine kinase
MQKPVIIGIAGGSASGKTSIAKRLKKAFESSNSVYIIRQDDYYSDQSHMPFEQRLLTNYDHPFAFDNDLLVEHLDKLTNRLSVEKPTYDFINHTRSNEIELVEPSDVIVLEGLFVLEDARIRQRLDIKIYVDTPADIRFIRRLVRDVRDRGRTLDSVVHQYTTTVRLMHEQFIEPTKRYADVIVPEGGKNEVAIDLLTTKISSIIRENML